MTGLVLFGLGVFTGWATVGAAAVLMSPTAPRRKRR